MRIPTRFAAALAAATLSFVALTGCTGVMGGSTPKADETPAATVPEVVGLTGDAALAAITDANLVPVFDGGEDGTVIMASNWVVDSSDPAAGTAVEPGSKVTLYASKIDDGGDAAAPDTTGLGAAVRAHIDASNPDGVAVPSWWLPVTDVEDVSSGTIRFYVQETLTDATRDDFARSVRNFVATDPALAEQLETIVIRDASGVDSNHYAW